MATSWCVVMSLLFLAFAPPPNCLCSNLHMWKSAEIQIEGHSVWVTWTFLGVKCFAASTTITRDYRIIIYHTYFVIQFLLKSISCSDSEQNWYEEEQPSDDSEMLSQVLYNIIQGVPCPTPPLLLCRIIALALMDISFVSYILQIQYCSRALLVLSYSYDH
jgi:hypothetical protein